MQRKVQETCGFTNVYGGIQLKCQKNRKHQKSIRLCGCILIAAFFIVLLSGKLPEAARRRQVRESDRQKQTYNNTYEKDVSKKQTDNTKIAKKNPKIRVLLMTTGYTRAFHTEVKVSGKEGLILRIGAKKVSVPAGKTVTIKASNRRLKKHTIKIRARKGTVQVKSIRRGYGTPSYSGTLELKPAGKKIALINELTVEDYLCAVVPSEMPVSYKLEALKAQAICARTYALQQQEDQRAKEFGADLDDSTSYQVYNNRQHGEKTDQAVKETAGLVMMQDGILADARYYSTSCGLDLHRDLSEESVFAAFLQENQIHSVEAEEPFYRWKTSIRMADLQEKTGWETIENLQVTERNEKGAVTTLEIMGQKKNTEQANERIDGEYQIRQFLALADPVITLQDGSTREGWQLLPSAFFYLQPVSEEGILTGYEVYGGGYGHGEGMSQNGARHMAEQGEDCETILKNYYGEIELIRYSS